MTILGNELLHGALVRLAGPRAEDAELMARWSEDAEYMRLEDSDWVRPHPGDEFARPGVPGPNAVEFRIRTLDDDRLIGFLALHSIEWNNQTGEISVGIGDRTYWNEGCGTDAMRLGLRYAFLELNLQRLTLDVISYNVRAVHVYERLGFRHEGALRRAVLRDGQRFDMLLMGILREEWEESCRPRVGDAIVHE